MFKPGNLVTITGGAAALARFVLGVRVTVFFFVLGGDVLFVVAFVLIAGVGLLLIGLVIVAFAWPCSGDVVENLVLVCLTLFRVEFGLEVGEIDALSFRWRRNGWRAGFSGWRGSALLCHGFTHVKRGPSEALVIEAAATSCGGTPEAWKACPPRKRGMPIPYSPIY
jgi:hypothetical protein